jgi:2-iminobutanoate/2-iminopropanoate deaminase
MRKHLDTGEAPKAPAIYSQAIVSNGLIFVAGQVPMTAAGKMIEGSLEDKLALIMQNIKAILKSAEATLDDVVKVTIYLTDIADLSKLNEVYLNYFSQPFPAREAVCVKELPLKATLEISVIAAQP